jgi:RNA polymerase sigma-70 factor (ECF subfamily)
MDLADRPDFERRVRALVHGGDVATAVQAVVDGYGSEIYGVICTMVRNEADAADVFSIFTENMWRGFPSFAWDSTLRTWAFTIARNAARRSFRQSRAAPRDQELNAAALNVIQQVRTRTRTWQRTEAKDWFARTRENLPEDDQLLLVLRVDKGLEWDELARVFGGNPSADATLIKREAARLRKRFQLLKDKLAELARQEGIIGANEA